MNTELQEFSISFRALPVINYALSQNGVKVLPELTISNNSSSILTDAVLRISSQPEFFVMTEKPLNGIQAKSSIALTDISPCLNGDFLAGLTERVSGVLTVALYRGESCLCEQKQEITVLTYDEWQGYRVLPEMLTSFITPNHPELAAVMRRASELLQEWTKDPSLDAYQSKDTNRVLKQAAAVFCAIKERGIVYCVSKASFENDGQRVRLCDAVARESMGSCLDLTLFYAACLEAIGLNALLLLKKDHIFAGLWLCETSFAESVQDDVSLVSKRLAEGVNEIAVVECTCMTKPGEATFDDAKKAAEKHLLSPESIELIIDVYRARLSGVRPVPVRILTDEGYRLLPEQKPETNKAVVPKEVTGALELLDIPETKATRMINWERKLLDLGLRNNLINMRFSKGLVPLLTTSVDELENALADGSDFSVLCRPSDMHHSEELSFDSFHEPGEFSELIRSEFKNRRLRSAFSETELKKAIKELYRTSKLSIEENGANTLYLALGLLRWYETQRSTKPRYAPVLLIPVEMVRCSEAKGYVIRLRDEEPQMNITMLEKLKQDFNLSVEGLEKLPMDEHGVDTRMVFTILRKAVMELTNFDVIESACLGIFSFTQFVMWNDIKNRSNDLQRNKIVNSLMEGRLTFDAKEMKLTDTVSEEDVFLPLPADASQLYAIQSAGKGESFVLHGPPGTGKSQTITALIANALAKGKTVLFVAEKMAALEVVQRRLSKIGLAPFCLELHSNKSRKRDVLDQIHQATEVTQEVSPEEYGRKAEEIRKLRKELDEYKEKLHEKLPCGMSLFELIGEYENCYEEGQDTLVKELLAPFSATELSGMTAERMREQVLLVNRMVAAGRAVEHPFRHPLARVHCTEYLQQMRESVPTSAKAYLTALQKYSLLLSKNREVLPLKNDSYKELKKRQEIIREILRFDQFPKGFSKVTDSDAFFPRLAKMAAHFKQAGELKKEFSSEWKTEIFTINAGDCMKEYQNAVASWALSKVFKLQALKKKLSIYKNGKVQNEELSKVCLSLVSIEAEEKAGRALKEQLFTGTCAVECPMDGFEKLMEQANAAEESSNRLMELTGSDEVRITCCQNPSCTEKLRSEEELFLSMTEKMGSFHSLLRVDTEESEDFVASEQAFCQTVLDNVSVLKEWISLNQICEEAENCGLSTVVAAYRKGLPNEKVYPAYRSSLCKGLLMRRIDETPVLSRFSGVVFTEKIAQFKKMDEELTTLAKKEIFYRLANQLPNFSKEASQNSEMFLLQRAMKSGGRGISIRKLFEQIPNILPKLCPCMLMSPISAAQYLDPKREPFDLVVFDEASQLPTCKAVGALARGTDAIIVGDPKQMPPTSFFSTNNVDEENIETEDLESILDDCLAMNMPGTHLLWHYRSRHESLIAFSNHQFYENRLYTFPSVNDRERKVQLIPVNGVFDRGKTRQNRAEAEAVVAEIVRRCHDSKLCKQSIGVVTFNIQQQNLIDDLLADACANDSVLENFVYSSEEPLFIKNLENVQGDERDVILFSIGFGPDTEGRVSVNFGPLNRDGGYRRLNVAVSRARFEMLVFATLTPEQIDLSKTAAEGVAALKAFLSYASGKELLLNEKELPNSTLGESGANSGIADAICEKLSLQGYRVEKLIGHSKYRIDIGVIDPARPERYLLGILLDGEAYKSSKTTRDRELAQVSVLNGLGWEIHRVYSMDWWDNSDKEIKKILSLLTELKEKAEEKENEEVVETVEVENKETKSEEIGVTKKSVKSDFSEAKPIFYEAARLPYGEASSEELMKDGFFYILMDRIQRVLSSEAPVLTDVVKRKVLSCFSISRGGSRTEERLQTVIDSMNLRQTGSSDIRILWRADQNPEEYLLIRQPKADDTKRELREIPFVEQLNAICFVLSEQFGLQEGDLIRETAKLFGFARIGTQVTSTLGSSILQAESEGFIQQGKNLVLILTEKGQERGKAVAMQLRREAEKPVLSEE